MKNAHILYMVVLNNKGTLNCQLYLNFSVKGDAGRFINCA